MSFVSLVILLIIQLIGEFIELFPVKLAVLEITELYGGGIVARFQSYV